MVGDLIAVLVFLILVGIIGYRVGRRGPEPLIYEVARQFYRLKSVAVEPVSGGATMPTVTAVHPVVTHEPGTAWCECGHPAANHNELMRYCNDCAKMHLPGGTGQVDPCCAYNGKWHNR